jgi:hypothetical protein
MSLLRILAAGLVLAAALPSAFADLEATAFADPEADAPTEPPPAAPEPMMVPVPDPASVMVFQGAPAPDYRRLSLAGIAATYLAVGALEYEIRFGGPVMASDFHYGGDGYFGPDTWAGGADKLGHAWASMTLTRGAMRILRTGGWKARQAAVLGAGMSWSLLLAHEIESGYAATFSPGNMVFNSLGALLGVALELSPRLDRLVDYQIEYWPSEDFLGPSNGGPVRRAPTVGPFEDFSGQNYILSFHIDALPGADVPWMGWSHYVDLVVGFHAEGYQPPPLDPGMMKTQSLFVGVSLNTLSLLDLLVGRSIGVSNVWRNTSKVLHGIGEVITFPGARLVLARSDRHPTP